MLKMDGDVVIVDDGGSSGGLLGQSREVVMVLSEDEDVRVGGIVGTRKRRRAVGGGGGLGRRRRSGDSLEVGLVPEVMETNGEVDVEDLDVGTQEVQVEAEGERESEVVEIVSERFVTPNHDDEGGVETVNVFRTQSRHAPRNTPVMDAMSSPGSSSDPQYSPDDVVMSDDGFFELSSSQTTWLDFVRRVFAFDGTSLDLFQRSGPVRVGRQAGRAENGNRTSTTSANRNNNPARARSRTNRQSQSGRRTNPPRQARMTASPSLWSTQVDIHPYLRDLSISLQSANEADRAEAVQEGTNVGGRDGSSAQGRVWSDFPPSSYSAALAQFINEQQVLGNSNGEDQYQRNLRLDEQVENRTGLTRNEIRAIKSTVVKREGLSETCCICLTDFEPRRRLKRLPCKHAFHPGCIDKWLRINANCPMCKQRLDGRPAT